MDILVGDEHINGTPVEPYDERVCDLLDAWAQAIRGDSEAKAFPDVLTFGFFIRKGSIRKKREAFLRSAGTGESGSDDNSAASDGSRDSHAPGGRRIGRGIAFHIAPSNVPVNCMYTLVFGLLGGCANIVRVPGREFPQVEILCRTLREVLKKQKFSEIKDRIQVLRYDREETLPDGRLLTEFFSEVCDVRVIWGGDETVAQIRKFPLAPRAREITFADRYSIGLISPRAVSEASEGELAELARNFYNDTYLMDQNACSTPQLIAWKNDLEADRTADGSKTGQAQERFWRAVAEEAKGRYELADIKVSGKFADLCEAAARPAQDDHESGSSEKMNAIITGVKTYEENLLYVCDTEVLSRDTTEECRGRFGMFYQYIYNALPELKPVMDHTKVQTVAVYGIDPAGVRDFVVENGLYGVDRVVPFGRTLDIDVVWDGYDLVREMSRIVAG